MADEILSRDANFVPVVGGVTDNSAKDITQIRVDETTKHLLTDSNSSEIGYASVGNGSIYVVNGGQIMQLPSVSCDRVFIQASENSTGPIVVGGSSVAATIELRSGLAIYPTQGVWFKVSNLNLLYITSTTSGDSIHYYYED